jgi:hypothetical protein
MLSWVLASPAAQLAAFTSSFALFLLTSTYSLASALSAPLTLPSWVSGVTYVSF